MSNRFFQTAALVLLSFIPTLTLATPEEMLESRRWMAERFKGTADALPPFSFSYNGKESAVFLKSWPVKRSERKLDENRTEITLTYTDARSGLSVRCVAVAYSDFPAVEWTPYFKNTSKTPTPIIEGIQALDAKFERNGKDEFVLHHSKGSPSEQSSYEPRTTTLKPGQKLQLATFGGRASNQTMPYWRLGLGDAGVVFAVGWPGQWAAQFDRTGPASLRIRAGQELTHFRLEPDEEVRAPMIAMVFWKGDRFRGHNLWRAWMLAHNVPRAGGELPPTQLVACSSHQFREMLDATEENQKLFIDRYVAERFPLRYWWMDAGWYVNDGTWQNVGTWEVDRKRFPNGLRAITDHGRAKGVKSIVWFEPERVTANSWIFKNHPEWCFEQDKIPAELKTPPAFPPPPHGYHGKGNLFNFGNPDAWQWMVDHIDKLIKDEGIDLYRQDFNIDPLPFWRAHDAPDRQGMTEIRYVTGYLAFWDELRRRHPDMLIDSCASGGRRNDLESLRRGVPLLRDDYLFEPIGQQGHTHGISYWIPFHGTGTIVGPSTIFNLPPGKVDVNLFRSHMAPSMTACWDMRRDDLDYNTLRRLVQEFEKVSPYYLGNYYPLTSYSLSKDVWMAWQFDRPDLSEGFVQAFRRDESPYESAYFKLHGLIADASYVVTNLDVAGETRVSGRQLMEKGLPVTVKVQPAAVVFTYKRVK
jgi:alpha-galactosidase